MKTSDTVKWGIAALLLALAGTGNVWADRGYGHRHSHGAAHFGVVVAPGWGPWPWYHPAPYYYPPYQTIVVERAPPVYIEQPLLPSAPPVSQTNYWYYCKASRAYYPYVVECPGGWRRVLPQPPNQP